jgi:lambda family phage portal protein
MAFPWLNRVFGRPIKRSRALVTRGLEAATLRRPWGAQVDESLGGSPLLYSAGVVLVRRKSQHAALNQPYYANAVGAIDAAAVGTGIQSMSSVADEAAKAAIAKAHSQWGENCDADQLGDIFALQSRALRNVVIDGESFVHMLPGPDGELRLRLLLADQCDMNRTMQLDTGGRIINGIEFDKAGKRVAYHILQYLPPLNLSVAWPPIRIPAEDICHVFRPLFPGQVRGIPWASSILVGLNELDQLFDAMLVAAKVSAMHAGFLIDQNSTGVGVPYDGHQKGSILDGGLEPGTLKILPSGFDVKFSSPQQVQTSIDLAKLSLRQVAAGLGVPSYLCDGDLSQANYSSLRAALVEFRRRIEQIQYHQLIPQLLRPVWRRWLTLEILAGRIDAPGFEDDPEAWLSVDWYPPGFPWVDPLKDAEAEVALIAAGLKSRKQSVAERGYDVVQLDAEIAADHAREKALGLNFSVAPPVTPPGTVVRTKVLKHDADGRILEFERRTE